MTRTANKKKKGQITISGAALHNLKYVDVEIPHNKLTVITGISGSGKSTLAFDTLYAEGQRRFVESLSAYARQFLERMNKPDVETISGLPPAVAIEQRKQGRNPRSTVGTTTEVYDYLRLLYGRIGVTHCRSCNKPVRIDTPESVVKRLLRLKEGKKIYILAPLSPQTRHIAREFKNLQEVGYFRFLNLGSETIHEFEDINAYRDALPEEIFILIDRMIIRKDDDTVTRLTDSIEQAFKAGQGKIKIQLLGQNKYLNFSIRYECADCDILYVEPEPRLFSFNNPFGACPVCQGFGNTIGINEDLVIPDKSKTLENGAIQPFRTQRFSDYQLTMIREAAENNVPVDVPYIELTDEQKDYIWEGGGNYLGINGFFRMLEDNNYKMHYRILISRYRGFTRCKACGGSRLRTSARQVFVGGKNLSELIRIPIEDLLDFSKNLKLTNHQNKIVGQVVSEIIHRLELLADIGLHYLTIDRLTHTLSGGEAQRINLSAALGSSLVGTLYVLDEPSIGMHPRDTGRLLSILFKLRNLGNTIVVVEHDPDIITKAEYLIDLGPRAGEHGGEIVYAGDVTGILKSRISQTGLYLSGIKSIPVPQKRREGNGHKLVLIKPRKHNLRMDKVEIPLGCMTVITGVSGSGKSTLIHDVLYDGVRKVLKGIKEETGLFEKIAGWIWLENVELVDQTTIGKSTRSTPITYTKTFDFIRELFASTQAAKQLGWKAGHFSFNVPGGRCDVCNGEGFVTVDMQFLPNVTLVCETCRGTRYKREARNILYKGKSIVDVLNMTVDEALEFFKYESKIVKKLQLLADVGLGYLRLGQPSTNLSGGEAQRIKLAGHLDTNYSLNMLFIFDEPTTGLHLDDINKLIECFNRLIEQGHSVIIIEHNMNIIASADYIIDLGPEAGEYGGHIIATGTPEEVAKSGTYTGNALRIFFDRIK
jgi:excinuclease ABC subunit A